MYYGSPKVFQNDKNMDFWKKIMYYDLQKLLNFIVCKRDCALVTGHMSHWQLSLYI